jgi:predicted CXXCH cytochrome family protein
MMSRPTIACVSLVVLLSVASLARSQQNPYRLKEPDQKKLCLACHTDFEQKLKNRFVHTPVRTGVWTNRRVLGMPQSPCLVAWQAAVRRPAGDLRPLP